MYDKTDEKIDKKTKNLVESGPEAELDRHRRLCTICNHPDREAIEEAFLQWRSVYCIRLEFHISCPSAIYRHAHATGLFARRSRRFRFALEHIIEHADHTKPTCDTIIRAIRAYSLLDDDGKWNEPPSQVVFSTTQTLPRAEAIPAEASLHPSLPALEAGETLSAGPFLIETSREIENAATE